ncbi:MAG: nitroreductase family protein [Dehalococcoidia bacterium]
MDTFEAIAARRNVREFTDRPISDDDLDRILEAGRRAPSASNRQWWDLVVCTGREQLRALGTVWRGAGHVPGSAATIAVVAPKQTEPMLADLLQFDLGQMTMSLILAATDLGIGTCHSAVGDQTRAREILGFPEDRFCALLLALGYPAGRPIAPLKRHNRRPIGEVVHRGGW